MGIVWRSVCASRAHTRPMQSQKAEAAEARSKALTGRSVSCGSDSTKRRAERRSRGRRGRASERPEATRRSVGARCTRTRTRGRRGEAARMHVPPRLCGPRSAAAGNHPAIVVGVRLLRTRRRRPSGDRREREREDKAPQRPFKFTEAAREEQPRSGFKRLGPSAFCLGRAALCFGSARRR